MLWLAGVALEELELGLCREAYSRVLANAQRQLVRGRLAEGSYGLDAYLTQARAWSRRIHATSERSSSRRHCARHRGAHRHWAQCWTGSGRVGLRAGVADEVEEVATYVRRIGGGIREGVRPRDAVAGDDDELLGGDPLQGGRADRRRWPSGAVPQPSCGGRAWCQRRRRTTPSGPVGRSSAGSRRDRARCHRRTWPGR